MSITGLRYCRGRIFFIRVRIGKATAVGLFGKMKKMWKNKCIGLKVKMRLYEAIILSTLLYCADIWPSTATLTKRLNAAHHRWQWSILGISWMDRVTNEEVRARTGQHCMDDTQRKKIIRWLGHVIRMGQQRICHSVTLHEIFNKVVIKHLTSPQTHCYTRLPCEILMLAN